MSTIDDTRDVREGEELDVDAVRRFLAPYVGSELSTLEVRQFPGGHSNLTYLLRAGEHEWVLRRPPFGANIESGHDMGREFRVLSGLERVGARAPKPVAQCDDDSVLGAPFYVMERVRGVIVRNAKAPPGHHFDRDTMRMLSCACLDNLVDIHSTDLEVAGFTDLGRPDGYVARQVEGWTRRYEKAKTDEVGDMESVSAWLLDNMPPSQAGALIHNDYKYDNLVLDPGDLGNIVAVLDWEMATVGDPLMDLGTTLGYWAEANDPDAMKQSPFPPTYLPGNLTRMEVVERYEKATGRTVDHVVFYYAYALFKIAVIAQQIYKRFKEGHTKDPRFGMLIFAVVILSETAAKAIERQRIHELD